MTRNDMHHQLRVHFWVMFGSRFLDKSSTNLEKVCNFGNGDSSDSFFSSAKQLDMFCFLNEKMGPNRPISCTNYING